MHKQLSKIPEIRGACANSIFLHTIVMSYMSATSQCFLKNFKTMFGTLP